MAKNKTIVKFRTRREVNIGLVIAFGILLLMIFQLYRYMTTPHLSLYEVLDGKTDSEFTASAMILRNETVYKTQNAGYLNFYFREGARVFKGAKVYSLNDSSSLQDVLNYNETATVLSAEDLARLKEDLRDLHREYSDVSFEKSCGKKEDFLADYLRYRDLSMLDLASDKTSAAGGFFTAYTTQSGTITYYSDRYDGYTPEMLNGTEFLKENQVVPERSSTTGVTAIDSFVYKIVDDLDWKLVVCVPEDMLLTILASGPKLCFSISGEDTVYEKDYETITVGGQTYLQIKMQRFVKEYLRYRFLDLTIYTDAATGLKIPKTALVERELYQIPEEFIVNGGGTAKGTVGVSLEYFDSGTGDAAYEFYALEPLFHEDGYYYVTVDELPSERYIAAPSEEGEPKRVMLHTFLTKMEGVYNMNKGYAVFRRIVRITDIDGYILVKAGLAGGVSLYDHIILDASAVSKDMILVEGAK